ncbi:MAG TPA: GNAT family N-acetyltransferase [Tepidisphaeraceae bacterium]|jgi:GNAT superfamily N-acetyltransferase
MSTIDGLNIRRGRLSDMVTLAAYNIHLAMETEHLRLDPYAVSAGVRAALEDPSKGIYFVADVAGRVIGQLMVTREWSDWRNGDIWWVQSVYVHPDFRKQGIFRALHAAAIAGAQDEGAALLRLYVEQENADAQAVYKKLGFATSPYRVMEQKIERPA